MSVEDLEKYEAEMELQLYKEYRDVLPMFKYVVETERRFYLANSVELNPKQDGWLEVALTPAVTSFAGNEFGPKLSSALGSTLENVTTD